MYVYTKSLNGNADFVYFLPWFLSRTNLNFRLVGLTHSFNIYMSYEICAEIPVNRDRILLLQ